MQSDLSVDKTLQQVKVEFRRFKKSFITQEELGKLLKVTVASPDRHLHRALVNFSII